LSALFLTGPLRVSKMILNLNNAEEEMCLSDLRRGEWARVLNIPDDTLRVQLLRFGIHDGSRVRCHARLPFGPVVLRYGGQEIALGREVARSIEIQSDRPEAAPRRLAQGLMP